MGEHQADLIFNRLFIRRFIKSMWRFQAAIILPAGMVADDKESGAFAGDCTPGRLGKEVSSRTYSESHGAQRGEYLHYVFAEGAAARP